MSCSLLFRGLGAVVLTLVLAGCAASGVQPQRTKAAAKAPVASHKKLPPRESAPVDPPAISEAERRQLEREEEWRRFEHQQSLLNDALRFWQAGELGKARTAFDLALTEYPDSLLLLRGRATFLFDTGGDGKEVRKDIQRGLRLYPTDAYLIGLVGQVVMADGELQQAEEFLLYATQESPDELRFWHALATLRVFQQRHEQAQILFDQLLQRWPSAAALHLGKIQAYRHVGDWEKVIEAADAALAIIPDVPGFHALRGDAYLRSGQWALAVRDLKIAVKGLPDQVDPASNLGLALYHNGQRAEAFAVADDLVQRFPMSPNAYALRGELHYLDKAWEPAYKNFDRAFELDPKAARALFQAAFCRRKLGMHREAARLYEKLLKLQGSTHLVCFNLANILTDLEQFERADELYRTASELNPLNAELWHDWGRSRYIAGDADAAIRYYIKSGELDPDMLKQFSNLTTIFFERHDWPNVVKYATLALENSRDVNLISLRGQAYHWLGQFERSVTDLQEVVRRAPDMPHAHESLAASLTKLRRWPEVKRVVAAGLQYEPDSLVLLDNGVEALIELDELDKAAVLARRLRKLAPDHGTPLVHLARITVSQGNLEEALKLMEQAIEREPTVHTIGNRGWILFEAERWEEALRDFDRALSLNPSPSDQVVMGVNRFRTLAHLGRTREAVTQLDELIAKNPNVGGWRLARAQLHVKHGDLEKALGDVRAAMRLGQDVPEALVEAVRPALADN